MSVGHPHNRPRRQVEDDDGDGSLPEGIGTTTCDRVDSFVCRSLAAVKQETGRPAKYRELMSKIQRRRYSKMACRDGRRLARYRIARGGERCAGAAAAPPRARQDAIDQTRYK